MREEKDPFKKEKEKKKGERERSFLNGNGFPLFPVPANFDQRTPLLATLLLNVSLIWKVEHLLAACLKKHLDILQ